MNDVHKTKARVQGHAGAFSLKTQREGLDYLELTRNKASFHDRRGILSSMDLVPTLFTLIRYVSQLVSERRLDGLVLL